ncbi:sugar ABC transporter ATP-binding protein [Pseudotabrizicola sp. 4114]|uniref:sugar ABC transporter ATP-binding protein n=1 Tax=Pseudotabrizicola sp. 4114 TaxID=2817731 RepID=UPI0028613C00|nr:ribose transport system ATP-binding protein [Pseudorhodobacter sp. 4114]
MTGPISIQVRGLSKRFGETHALTDCDFDAYPGEVHAIVGENGSGKSTLAKILSGVLIPDAGSVEVFGRPVKSPIAARERGVATIFQEVLVADEANVIDNLYVGSEGLLSNGKSHAEKVREADEILRRCVGHPVDLRAKVGTLPLNVKQWIVIARAILRQPKVLILDESSAALDLGATTRLHAEIERLRDQGCTILIVTHRIAELVRIADRATILRDGKAVGVLETSEITEARLLELMTQAGRTLAAAPVVFSDPGFATAAPVITATQLRLFPESAAFDFRLQPGMIVGLAGLDGQGQDRFARTLAGIAAPASGEVICLDETGQPKPLSGLDDAYDLHVSWVSGDRKREGIFPQRSIFENFAMGIYRRNLGLLGKVDRHLGQQLFTKEVDRLKIKTGPISNRITSLSGGNQQKVLISRAFADDPRVIVLNDPARGVDLGTKRDLYRELQAFARNGGSVVYLSSEIEEFLGFAHRVDVFVNGSIFRSLEGAMIAEEAMLAAMFGQPPGTHIEIA